jgi:WS/DGAT/MGAT family acyltransferase
MTMRQVDELGAMYLAAENDRTRTHTALLATIDPAALAGGRLTVRRLRELLRERLDLVPAFHRRLAAVPFGLDRPFWIDCAVDLDFHVREIALPEPGDDEVLREQVARIFSRPLDRSRPLWEMYLVQGLAGGRAAVLTKVHHALADAQAGLQILGALADAEPNPQRRTAPPPGPSDPPPRAVSMLVHSLSGLVRQPVRAVTGLPAALSGADELPVVGSLPGVRLVGAAAALAGRRHPHRPIGRAPRTSFNGRISAQRRIGVADVPFDDVRFVKRHFAVSVNDVVMAIAAGALRRWLLEHSELPDRSLTAVVPVSLRRPGSAAGGNQLSAVVVPLPTDVGDPAARLGVAHRAMLVALRDLRTTAPNALTDTIRLVPPPFLVRTVQFLSRLNAWAPRTPATNVNISNIRGPGEPLYLAGAVVESLVPLAGITDGLGLNLTVMSYRDRLAIGIVADREEVPDVQCIADSLGAELAALVTFAAH